MSCMQEQENLVVYQFEKSVSLSLSKAGCKLSCTGFDKLNLTVLFFKIFHSKYKIHTVAIDWENIHGTRVTPHVYTSTKDLDRLVKAVREMVG